MPWEFYEQCFVIVVTMFPAEGFTVMRISLDRKRVLCQPLERESKDLTLNKILQIWLAAMGLNLMQGLLFWDYDEGVSDFKKCSDVSKEGTMLHTGHKSMVISLVENLIWFQKNQSRNGGPLPSFIFLGFYFIAVFLLPCVTMMKGTNAISSTARHFYVELIQLEFRISR